MKTIHILYLAAIMLLPLAAAPPATAREVTVTWDANAPEEKVTGYVLSIRKGDAWETLTDTADTEVNVSLPDGASVIAVAAVNAQGFRGPMSEPLTVLPLPSAPLGLKMRITIELESATR